MADPAPTPQESIELEHGPIVESFPNPKQIPNEEIVNKNRNHNAWIVIGRDRPAGLSSGFGRFTKNQGGDKCTTIDIFVGLDSYDAGKEGHTVADEAGNNIQNDASRIYISQKTNIDENFLIDKAGTLRPAIGKAAIGIKSDNLRFVGRESIKLVANSGERNTQGFRPSSANPAEAIYGIQLITGFKTDISEVQGIVKSKNTEHCFREIIESIDSLWATLRDYINKQKEFNSAVASHTHTGFLDQKYPGTSKIMSSPELNSKLSQVDAHLDKNAFHNVSTNRLNVLTKILKDYLEESSPKYIGSRFNKTN